MWLSLDFGTRSPSWIIWMGPRSSHESLEERTFSCHTRKDNTKEEEGNIQKMVHYCWRNRTNEQKYGQTLAEETTKKWGPWPPNHKQQPDWLGVSLSAWSRQEFSLSNSRLQYCDVLRRAVTLMVEIMNTYGIKCLELMHYGYNRKHKLLNINVLKYRIM